MLSLLQRRRQMMMLASGGGPGPLYQLLQGSLPTGNASIAITVTGAHIWSKRAGGGTGTRPRFVSDASCSTSALTSTWFELAAGDAIDLYIKNISYTLTSGSQSLIEVTLQAGSTMIVKAVASAPAVGSGTLADVHVAVTLSSAKNATCFQLYAGNVQTVEYDIELWVNGTRYI